MAQFWTELLPIDRYTVASNGLLHDYDRKVISMLYQPLIGSVSFSLYMTLWAQVEENRLWSHTNSHHSLMGFMDLNLRTIYEARLKLEGIGLLKTYVKSDEEFRSFIYELQPPLPPEQFFLDGMLNIYLYQQIGKMQYGKLKQFFLDKKLPIKEGYVDTTKAFQEVYESASPSVLEHHKQELEEEQIFIGRSAPKGIQIKAEDVFDFDLLMAGLSEALVPKKTITPKVKEAIGNLAVLYGIDPIHMKNLLISAVDEDNQKVDIEALRKAARDWYQLEHSDQLPVLVDKVQPALKQAEIEIPKTKEEKLIHYLDTTSPRQLLIDMMSGANPAKADLQIIEDVMFNFKLLPGVINVLIQYVLLKTDMKLTKGYVEKIASHWARKKVSTVQEAMDLAKNEHRQYLEWAENKKTPKSTAKRKPIRTEALPDWFFDQEEEKPNEGGEGFEEKKREIEERLKKYKQ